MWLSVNKSSSLSETKIQGGTHEFSAGAIPYLWVRLPLFAIGAEEVAKQYCSCQGDRYVCYHPSWRSTSTRAWGVHLAYNHHGTHDGCCGSCCSSESKTKHKSTKEILSKRDSFFWSRCPCSTKRTGHCAWPCCSFSWSDRTCDHPSSHRTCLS